MKWCCCMGGVDSEAGVAVWGGRGQIVKLVLLYGGGGR